MKTLLLLLIPTAILGCDDGEAPATSKPYQSAVTLGKTSEGRVYKFTDDENGATVYVYEGVSGRGAVFAVEAKK